MRAFLEYSIIWTREMSHIEDRMDMKYLLAIYEFTRLPLPVDALVRPPSRSADIYRSGHHLHPSVQREARIFDTLCEQCVCVRVYANTIFSPPNKKQNQWISIGGSNSRRNQVDGKYTRSSRHIIRKIENKYIFRGLKTNYYNLITLWATVPERRGQRGREWKKAAEIEQIDGECGKRIQNLKKKHTHSAQMKFYLEADVYIFPYDNRDESIPFEERARANAQKSISQLYWMIWYWIIVCYELRAVSIYAQWK